MRKLTPEPFSGPGRRRIAFGSNVETQLTEMRGPRQLLKHLSTKNNSEILEEVHRIQNMLLNHTKYQPFAFDISQSEN